VASVKQYKHPFNSLFSDFFREEVDESYAAWKISHPQEGGHKNYWLQYIEYV